MYESCKNGHKMKKRTSIILVITLLASPLFAQGYHSLGRNAYVYRNYEKARELFLKDVETADRGDSYYFLGEIEKIENNYDKAAEYFKTAVTKSMTRKYMVNAYWNLIIFSEEKNDYNNVVAYCKELWIKTGASSAKNKIDSLTNRLLWTDNQEAIEKYKAAMELLKKGNSMEAEKNFRDAINLDRNFLAPKFELGMKAYKEQNENDALYYLSEITAKIPFYYDLQLIVGDINFKNRNYRTAASNFSNAIDYGFISETQLNNTLIKRGTCYFHLSDLNRAEEDIKKAVDSINIKKNLDPLLVLSAIYIKKNNFEDALKTLAKAESVAGDNSFILFQTGSIHYHNKDWKYVSYFDRLFDTIDKKNPDAVKPYMRAFTILMQAHYDKNNYSRSLVVSETINEFKKDYNALTISARSNYYLSNNDKAIEIFESISLNNEDRFLLSSAYAKRGDKEKASAILKNLLYNPDFKDKALKDKYLRPIVESIEAEKTAPDTTTQDKEETTE